MIVLRVSNDNVVLVNINVSFTVLRIITRTAVPPKSPIPVVYRITSEVSVFFAKMNF